MAKGQFFAIFAVCLLATAQPLPQPQPQLDILGAVLTPVVGVVGGVADTLVGVTGPLKGLVGTVTDVLDSVVDSLTKTLDSVISSLESTLATVANVPLQAVAGVEKLVNDVLSPTGLASAVAGALQLNAITDLVGQLGNTVGCVLNKAVSGITNGLLQGVVDILKCARPLVAELKNVTKAVKIIVGDAVQLVEDALKDISKCAKEISNPPDLGKVVGCIVEAVSKGVSKITAIVEKAKPYIISALNTAVKAVECIVKVLSDGLGKSTAVLNDITKCIAQQGGTKPVIPIPSVTVNFTAIANKTLAAVLNLTSAAVGANSSLANLTAAIAQLQNATSSVSPVAIVGAVNSSIVNISAEIDVAANGSVSPNLAACVAAAKQSANNLAAAGVEDIVECAETIGPDAVEVATEAGKLELTLKADAVKAPTDVFAKCSALATSLDDSVQKCFDGALDEVKKTVANQEEQIKKATAGANKLIARAKNCLDKGQGKLAKQGQAIVATLKQCLVTL